MSEEQMIYNSKSITYTELADFIGGFCKQKIFENGHKTNPMSKTYQEIDDRIEEEYDEFHEAFVKWLEHPTEENRNSVLMEIADIVNFWIFWSGKIEGYTTLMRK